MLLRKKILTPLYIALQILSTFSLQSFQLAEYDYKSAAVLPTFTHRSIKWAILSREGYGISKKYTYDSFSGGRDKGEIHPTQTAAHEFLQEAILELVLKWDLDDAEKFIDPEKENTWMVIAYSKDKNQNNPKTRDVRNVLYIVNFNKYKNKLFDNFYDARAQEMARYEALHIPTRHRTTTEKDKLAKVRWKDLKSAILSRENSNDPVTMQAYVLDPKTQDFHKELITLRPILVMTLRPFFNCQPYDEGDNEKIRHYYE